MINGTKANLVYEAKKFNTIRTEIEEGNFKQFIKQNSYYKSLIISGYPGQTDSHLNWNNLSKEHQVTLLKLLDGVSFERLHLGSCSSLTFPFLEKMLQISPELEELELSGHAFVDEESLDKILGYTPNLRILILRNLPNLRNIKKTPQSLIALRYLVISQNPNLETLSFNAPHLKSLLAENNGCLKFVKTNSRKLNKANLQNNPQLTREGIEKTLASREGIRNLEDLNLSGSYIFESALLKTFPILLTHNHQSQIYKTIHVLSHLYLGANWQMAPLSEEKKSYLGVLIEIDLKDWFFRYDVVRTLGERFRMVAIPEQEEIRFILQEQILDGYAQVSYAAAKSLLETYQTTSLDKLIEFISQDNTHMNWDVRHSIAQALHEYCPMITPEACSQILKTLFTLIHGKNSNVLNVICQILGKCYRFATLEERDQILYILQEQSEDEQRQDRSKNSSLVRCAAINALAECCDGESDLQQQDQILSYLLWCLRDKDHCVHGATIQALGRCFKNAKGRRDEIFSILVERTTKEQYLDVWAFAIQALSECYLRATPSQQIQILGIGLRKGNMQFQKPSFYRRVAQNQPSVTFQQDYNEKNACAFAIQLLGKCYPMEPSYQTQIMEIALSHATTSFQNPSISCKTAQTLAECYKTAISEKRSQILLALNHMTKSSDIRHSAALEALGECCKVATVQELKQILSMFIETADKNKESHNQITLILHALGQIKFPPLILQTYLRSFAIWSNHENLIVRKILVQGLWGWVEKETHPTDTLFEIAKLLYKLVSDPKETIQLSAKMAFVKLQTHFDLEKAFWKILDQEPEIKIEHPSQSSLQAPGEFGIFGESPFLANQVLVLEKKGCNPTIEI